MLFSITKVASSDKSDNKPVEDLDHRNEAEAKAESKQATHAGDEINHCHPERSFVF